MVPDCISDYEQRMMHVGNREFFQTLSKLNMHGCSHEPDACLLPCKKTVYMIVLGPRGAREYEQKEARGAPLDTRAKEGCMDHHLE